MALWPDWQGYFPPSLPIKRVLENRVTRPYKRPLGTLFELAPRAFSMALWPDSLQSSWWGGLVGSSPANHQTGNNAIEKSRKATS